jgi:protein-tyrosine phosphatase
MLPRMIPLVDTHCHLLAGLDDGPQNDDDALAMCRMAYDEGVRMTCALAHQNDRWPDVTPARIREATQRLAVQLREARIPLTVFPCAEVMVGPDTEADWRAGRLLSVADRGKYLLIEMPNGLFVDVRALARKLVEAGVHPILAHADRYPEYLDDTATLEELVRIGCLVQVSTKGVTEPPAGLGGRELKSWFKRGLVHVLGTDAHSPRRRSPRYADAYQQVVRWVGNTAADRICSTNGLAIVQGLFVRVPAILPRSRRWFAWW